MPEIKKRKKSKTPTARTLEECRKRGWTAQVVEKWLKIPNPRPGMPPGVRIDLFDVIDVVACVPPVTAIMPGTAVVFTPGHILGIQACSMTDRGRREAKCRTSAKAAAWLASGGRLEVWAWRPLKVSRGGKAIRWELDVTPIESVAIPPSMPEDQVVDSGLFQ